MADNFFVIPTHTGSYGWKCKVGAGRLATPLLVYLVQFSRVLVQKVCNLGVLLLPMQMASIVLEVFQLGVLFPAAAFTHGPVT